MKTINKLKVENTLVKENLERNITSKSQILAYDPLHPNTKRIYIYPNRYTYTYTYKTQQKADEREFPQRTPALQIKILKNENASVSSLVYGFGFACFLNLASLCFLSSLSL